MPCHQPFRDDSAQFLLYKIAGCLAEGGSIAGVSSFNGQTGAVVLTAADIATALGCTPACDDAVVTSFNGRQGVVTLTLADVSGVADARYVLKSGDAMTGALAIGNGVLAVASDPFLNLSQTWNNAAVAFTAFKSNVTATAAAAASLLFDVQQNAATVFNLRTDGRLTLLGRASFTTTSSIGHAFAVSDALNTAASLVASLAHTLSAGVGAAGMGVSFDFTADTATVAVQRQLRLSSAWTDATQATRTSSVTFTLPVSGTETITLTIGGGQVQVRDGLVGTPGLTFANDADTGLYRIGADTLGVTVGGALILSVLATGLNLNNVTAPGADPTTSSQQWAASGEWQYRSSTASEGAGQTNRVHNRAAQVLGSGTDYTLTAAIARVDFGTTDPEVVLPTAGTYLLLASVQFISDALSTNDLHIAAFRNSTDAVTLSPAEGITLGVSFFGYLELSTILTVTASKTIQLWAYNFTAARGIVVALNTAIKYVRLY